MGCDIHTIAQVKRVDKWETIASNIAGEGRSYNSFAVLANVRNGRGFAGVKTGEGWNYIAEPKGLPEDIAIIEECGDVRIPPYYCEFFKETQETKWLGDHSHSHHTLKDIENFVETLPKKYTVSGVIDKTSFKAIQNGELEEPMSWCGGVGGSNITVVSQIEALNGVPYSHVQYSWQSDTEGCLGYLYNVIEELRELANREKVTHDNIRFVFGFDS